MLQRFALVFLVAAALVAGPVLAQNPRVAIETTQGTMVVELDPEKAPATVENFLAYVDMGFYDSTVFHRVIDGFMIQGGGFTKSLQKKGTNASIVNEATNGLSNARGTISMARTNNPHSATAQFFINSADNGPGLDQGKTGNCLPNDEGVETCWGYAVFGKVVEGEDVIDKISKVATETRNGMRNVPVETVMINAAKRVE